jgi:hypothetical protein
MQAGGRPQGVDRASGTPPADAEPAREDAVEPLIGFDDLLLA